MQPTKPTLYTALFLCVVAAIVVFPFLLQAFHIDDSLNIAMARQILAHPADPYGFAMPYNGVSQPFYRFYANPPLNGYILAPLIYLFGESEAALHFFYGAWVFIAGFVMCLLGRKFLNDRTDAYGAALLLVVSPAVFVMAHTIMPDMPLLCFYLASVYLFLEAGDRSSLGYYLLAGLCAALACLTRYSGVTLIPLFALCAFARRQNRSAVSIVAIAIPLLALYGWYRWSSALYASAHWQGITSLETGGVNLSRIGMHFLANITYLAGASIFPLSFLFLARKIKGMPAVAVLIAGVGATIACAVYLHTRFAHTIGPCAIFCVLLFSLCAFLAALAGGVPGWAERKAESILLIAWLGGVLFFNSLFLHTAVKYNMLAIPPLIFLFMPLLKTVVGSRYTLYRTVTIIATFFLGAIVAVADTSLANTYRTFAQNICREGSEAGKKTFYVGHWGWDYYMQKGGAEPLFTRGGQRIESGNKVVIASLPWPQPLPTAIAGRLVVRDRVEIKSPLPVRTMNGWAKAFFFANYNAPSHQGVLPYAFSSDIPIEVFAVLEVK